MAIDRTGISSLNAGASDITYTGNEGPKSPDQQLMASADPMLVEEYQKYVFEMEEQGQTPISFREFVEQIMAESRMAEGGRIGFKKGTDKKWMQKVSASIKKRGTKGKCTPITKPGCTGRAKALAKTFKKIAAKRKA